jgi:phage gpG-like protein
MIEVSVAGIEAVKRALEKLQKVAGAPEEIARDIGIVVERRIKRAFGAATAPEIGPDGPGGKGAAAMGRPWAELAAETLLRRRKGKGKGRGGARILQDTGRLKQSIASIVAGGVVTIGTGVAYGLFHQGGTKYMPARPFVGINNEDREMMVKMALRYLEAAVK